MFYKRLQPLFYINITCIFVTSLSLTFLARSFDMLAPNEKKEDIQLLFTKLGCFKDDPHKRDLAQNVSIKKSTQEECAKACVLQDKSFSYFGMQDGKSCYCGKQYGKYGKISDDDCNLKCDGDGNEFCGGKNANNVFFFGIGKEYFRCKIDLNLAN